jgi:hypothetical protein
MAKNLISEDNLLKSKSVFEAWPFVIVGWVAMLIFACHASTHMVAAGDTWVAMACGRHFTDSAKIQKTILPFYVDTNEPFSANSHRPGPTPETMHKYAEQLRSDAQTEEGFKASLMHWWADKADNFGNWPNWLQNFAKHFHPTGWIDQNWLTHVIFYSLVPKSTYTPSDTFTSNALVYWKFAIYILTVFCVYYTARLLGVNPLLAAAFTCFAIFTGRSYFDIRPAGFSNLFVAIFILILVLATYKNIFYIWLIVPATVIWSNLHGGYVYVFLMMTVFIGTHFLSLLPRIWSVLLYNILVWPAYFIVYSSTDWQQIRPEEAGPTAAAYAYLFFALVIIDIFLFFSRDKLVSIGRKGLYHSIVSSVVAFIAMIIFNPFHLTNLTHTFVISIGKHAQKWRSVNEWHSAFEWTNDVGTSYPFLIIFVLIIATILFWFFTRRLVPKFLPASKDRIADQPQRLDTSLKIFAFLAAIFLFWLTLLSFAFIDYDPVSFIVCIAFAAILLLSIFHHIYHITLLIPILLIFSLSESATLGRAGFEGRYIYPFILIPAYCIMAAIASLLSKKALLKPVNLAIVGLTAVIMFFLMSIIYNPFNLTVPSWPSVFSEPASFLNCFSQRISTASSNLLNLKAVWLPTFVHNASPSYGHLFLVLYIVNFVSIIAFLLFNHRDYFYARQSETVYPETKQEQYKLPKIDFALWAVAALTVYMAARSRRFIPIAAMVACPVVALLIQQIVCSVSASVNFQRRNRLALPAMSDALQKLFLIVAVLITSYLGTTWTLRFKDIYLDPWPMDYKLNSVFIRMSASDAKPFYALKFIKDNKLSGNMFNYWTEGGFIAWGQQPDPNTGRTPLQLFMDGRAQAAYDPKTFDAWSVLMSGGPQALSDMQNGIETNYKNAGAEVAGILRKYNVWVILMPIDQFDSPFMKAIDMNSDWIVIYYDNVQRLLVDRKNPGTKRLFNGISEGTTVYPNEFSKNLILAYYKLGSRNPSDLDEGLDCAFKAFYCEPSQVPLERIIAAAGRYTQFRPKVDKFCTDIVDDFEKNKELYKKQDGYHNRLVTVLLSFQYLQHVAEEQKNPELTLTYIKKYRQYEDERQTLADLKRW